MMNFAVALAAMLLAVANATRPAISNVQRTGVLSLRGGQSSIEESPFLTVEVGPSSSADEASEDESSDWILEEAAVVAKVAPVAGLTLSATSLGCLMSLVATSAGAIGFIAAQVASSAVLPFLGAAQAVSLAALYWSLVTA
jgi:hypothetical protein|eukprot:5145167-Prymnesium_polylepis.2